MNPIFIYQNEITLKNNNKFSIYFIDDEIVNFISFSTNNQYYISSLDCNITKANEKKVTHSGTKALVNELSKTSRELLDKGAIFKNDISQVTSFLTPNFNLPRLAPQNYNLVLDPKVINDNCYSYQFYDSTDKRIKYAKIYSPFSHLKNGLIFKGGSKETKNEKVLFQLVDNYTKIKCVFLHSTNVKWKIGMNLYRDLNAKFVRERQSDGTWRWWATNPNLPCHAEIYARNNDNFIVNDFMREMCYVRRFQSVQNGKWKVIGNYHQSTFNGDEQPFIQKVSSVEIQRNKPFLIPGSADNKRHNFGFGLILDECTYIGWYKLTDHDKQEINKLHPDFSFNTLGEYVSHSRSTRNTKWEIGDLTLFPSTEYKSRGKTKTFDIKKHFMKFVCSNTKYEDYLDSNIGIFYFDSYRDLPDDLQECEKLFDKDVLEIKKLVQDIGAINEITKDEQLNLSLYDDSNLIEETYIQRFNKHLQLYGFISIPFANTKKSNIITLNNLLPL